MLVAWMFPGQGSQIVGMGTDLIKVAEVYHRFAEAESILGWSLVDLTEVELKQTSYTQQALFLVEAILSDLLKQNGCQFHAVAGDSLGEYGALYCAGVFDFTTGLHLVKHRSRIMESHCGEGTMVAIIGFDRSHLEEVCQTTQGVIIANDNSPDQVVLSGIPKAIEIIIDAITPSRVVPLSVAGAFHSPLMNDAAVEFDKILENVVFYPAQVPIYSNVTAIPTQDPVKLKTNLQQQINQPVRWHETLFNMHSNGIDELWEIGPGEVLSKLAKRFNRSLRRVNVATYQDIKNYADLCERKSINSNDTAKDV